MFTGDFACCALPKSHPGATRARFLNAGAVLEKRSKETVIREVDTEVIEWTADGTRQRYRLNWFQLIRQGRGSRAPASSIVSKQDTSFIIIAIPVQLC
jgi:hypothetical protein